MRPRSVEAKTAAEWMAGENWEAAVSAFETTDTPAGYDRFHYARAAAFSGDRQKALRIMDGLLSENDGNTEYMAFRGRVHFWEREFEAALRDLQAVLKIDPDQPDIRELIETIRAQLASKKIKADFKYDRYSPPQARQNEYSVEWSHTTDSGSKILRVNYADRFDKYDQQFEIDLYPRIKKYGGYAYLNFGLTDGAILFPSRRWGYEYYKKVGGYELSLGKRHLEFGSDDVDIYTGSLTEYVGNSYWTFRAYHTPGQGSGSKSWEIYWRSYLGHDDQYLWTAYGRGKMAGRIRNTTDLAVGTHTDFRAGFQNAFHRIWIYSVEWSYQDDKKLSVRRTLEVSLSRIY